MTHTYQLTGMTCTSCEAKVKSLLERVENVTNVEVSKEYDSVTISMDRHINLSTITLLIQLKSGHFILMEAMQHFMAGFFLVFSFFKLLNLKGFAESYVMYDVVAKKFSFWAYSYAFVEVGLGISYLLNYNPLVTNACTFVVMSISIIGVLQSVFDNKKIQCACLGAVFNLPMSTVTIIEDALMIVMSGYMILNLF